MINYFSADCERCADNNEICAFGHLSLGQKCGIRAGGRVWVFEAQRGPLYHHSITLFSLLVLLFPDPSPLLLPAAAMKKEVNLFSEN